MEARWWLTVLVCCVAAGLVRGCCGDPDDPPGRVERATRHHRRYRNETRDGRRGVVRRALLRRISLDRLREIQNMDLTTLLATIRGARHPEFASFIADSKSGRPILTATNTTTGLLGAGRPPVQGSKQSALRTDLQEVASERRSVNKDAGCKPRKVPVEVPHPDDPLLLYTPSCVLIPRCSGCCGHELLQCVPTEVKNIRKKVLALRLSEDDSIALADQDSSIERITMEKHVKCGCQCKVKESSCSRLQRYDAANCRCYCPNERDCPGTKIWSEADCTCKCAKVSECSTGLEFDSVQCRCLPIREPRPLLFGTATQAPHDSGSGGSVARTPAVPDRRDTPAVPDRRHTPDGRDSPAVGGGGTTSSGWGTAVSSGVIEDQPPTSRSRPTQPSRTSSAYQPVYQTARQPAHQPAYADRRNDQAGASSSYDHRNDQAGASSSYDRRNDQTDASSAYDRRNDQAGALPPYDRRNNQAGALPRYDRRNDQTGASFSYPGRRNDQTSAWSRNDRRYDQTGASSRYDHRNDQTGASSRYDHRNDQTSAWSRNDRRYDQTGAWSRNDRRNDQTGALPRYDRRNDQTAASSRYPDRRSHQTSYPSHNTDTRYG